jgi:transposase-like protein
VADLWGLAVARNTVQFQKGLSEPEFDRLYGSEEQCRAIVVGSRWPKGFECPGCGGTQHSVVKTRDLYQCTNCRLQTSPIAGTIFASTKLSLRTWFRAIYHMTQTKQGISSIELGRRLGVTQTTAWKIKHKLKQVMLERDSTKRLTGRVEIDAPTSVANAPAASGDVARRAKHRSSRRSKPASTESRFA